MGNHAFDRTEARDLEEAYACGRRAVELAAEGTGAVMVSIQEDGSLGTAPLAEVAVRAKPMPQSFLNEAGNFPSEEFLAYCRPLISELPSFVRLEPKYYSGRN